MLPLYNLHNYLKLQLIYKLNNYDISPYNNINKINRRVLFFLLHVYSVQIIVMLVTYEL